MATPRSRSSSFHDGPTFVNFSTPGRTMSMKSDISATFQEQVEAAFAGTPDLANENHDVGAEDLELPYRPVKTNFVQLHVTSNNKVPLPARLSLDRPRPGINTWNSSRPQSRDSQHSVRPASRDAGRQSLNFSRPRSASASSRPSVDIARPQPSLNASVQSLPRPAVAESQNPFATSRRSSFSWKKADKSPLANLKPQPPPPSPGGSFRFHSTPTLTKTPWEIERGKPKSRWSRTSNIHSTLPARIFRELPKEIYHCILDHVENVFTRNGLLDVPGSRALMGTLCLVDRKWNRVAREHLYREIWLPSNRIKSKKNFLRQQKKSKLKLLQRTLCNASEVAFLVYDMRITATLADEMEAEANALVSKDSVLDILQDIIRQCYNLEKLGGYIPAASTANLALYQALATRTRLKAQAWYLDSSRKLPSLGVFISCHEQWKNLESLVIVADPDVDLCKIAVPSTLAKLPKLANLMLAGLHNEDFHNGSLLALPALKSLRLERLGGITEQGIQQLAYSRLAPRLERLSLVGLEVKKLETVQTLLSHLTRLKSFVLVQDASPEPQAAPMTSKRPNLLMSASLEYLHWDCLVPGSALSRFAEAVQTGKFPQLRKVKVPCDFDGSIQTLCQPVRQVQLTQKDLNYLDANFRDGYERNLVVSQIQSQLRVRKYYRTPSYRFAEQSVVDENGFPHDIGSCIGSSSSQIEYSLAPDVDAAALAGFDEVARPRRSGYERLERRVELDSLF